jgi:hypothetical protein
MLKKVRVTVKKRLAYKKCALAIGKEKNDVEHEARYIHHQNGLH